MDLNTLELRFERIHASINSRIDDDFKRHVKIEFSGKSVSAQLPGKDDEFTVANQVLSILHHLATLKDHLKNSLEKNGYNKQIVEEIINSSIHLQVLIDLVNADKHGYPVRSSRSNKNPVIKNINQGVINNNYNKPIVMSISPKGELNMLEGVPPSVILTAGIFDGAGGFLFDFDSLVETCFFQWESIAKEYNFI